MSSVALKTLKYFEAVRVNYFENTAYIADLLGTAGLVMVRIWIFSQIYRLAFQTQHSSEIGGLSFSATIWLMAFTQSFFTASQNRKVIKEITEEVKEGIIAYTITKPYNYVLFNFFGNYGVLAGRIVSTLVLGAIAAFLLVGPIHVSLVGLVAGLILFLFGFCINTLVAISIGLLAFWSEETSPYRWIYDKFNWIFGGIFIPLTVFPETFKRIANVLPFSHLFYYPALMIVKFNIGGFVKILITQFFWILILSIVITFIYKRGVKNLSVNGG